MANILCSACFQITSVNKNLNRNSSIFVAYECNMRCTDWKIFSIVADSNCMSFRVFVPYSNTSTEPAKISKRPLVDSEGSDQTAGGTLWHSRILYLILQETYVVDMGFSCLTEAILTNIPNTCICFLEEVNNNYNNNKIFISCHNAPCWNSL